MQPSSSEKSAIPFSESYKDKLLNLFGEVATQKILNENVSTENGSQGKDVNMVQQDSLPVDYEDGVGIEVPLSDLEWNLWSQPRRKTLIFKVMGKNINFKALENNLQKKWQKKRSMKIVDMPDGFYLVYFSIEEDYSFALFEGPWMIADHYLIVQRWRPMFLQNAEMIKKKLQCGLGFLGYLWNYSTLNFYGGLGQD